MKKILTGLTFIIFLMICHTTINKEKIIIFTCNGGGGHMSAARAISDYLKEMYDIEIINTLSDTLKPVDPIKKITLDNCIAEDLYNFLLRNNYNWCINKLGDFGQNYIYSHGRKIKKCLSSCIQKAKPNLIISVIPYLNDLILNIAEQQKIPFLIIPTDLDISTFILRIIEPKFEKFYLAMAFNDPILNRNLEKNKIPKKKIKYIGYPLRTNFYEKNYDSSVIKKNFLIPEDKDIVMILMGATGSSAIYSYVMHLAKSKLKIHLLICLGRNKGIEKKLKKIKFSPNVSFSIIGYTNKTAELMYVSNILITKSGTASICEAIQMELPVLVDNTAIPLKWEKMSCDFIKEHKLGFVVKSFKKTNEFIEKYFSNRNELNLIKSRMAKFKNKNFGDSIKLLVKKMLQL